MFDYIEVNSTTSYFVTIQFDRFLDNCYSWFKTQGVFNLVKLKLQVRVVFSDTCLAALTNDMIHLIVSSAIIWAVMDSEENNFHYSVYNKHIGSIILVSLYSVWDHNLANENFLGIPEMLSLPSKMIKCSYDILTSSESFICWITWIQLQFL